MMDSYIQQALELRQNHPRHYCKLIKKLPRVWEAIENYCKFIPNNETLSVPQKVYHFVNQINIIPRCPIKGIILKFRGDKFDYRKYSERGLATNEMIQRRSKNRKLFPNTEQRLKNVDTNFLYEENYHQIALDMINDMFKTTGTVGGVCASLKTSKHAKLYMFIKNCYLDASTFSECLYRFVNNIREVPLCPFTQIPLEFINFNQGYKSNDPSAAGLLKIQTKRDKLKTAVLLSKDDTIKELNNLIDYLKQNNVSINNLRQSAGKRCPDLIESVEHHTKEYRTLTNKWSERAYLLVHQAPEDMNKCRFSSFDEGYYDTYVHANSSLGENELMEWIKSLNIGQTSQHRRILNGREIDIFVEQSKIGIEYHGEYYHNFEFKGSNYHKQKADVALHQGIRLIQIFETEWYNKQEIVKSIIKSKLGIVSRKIHARSCTVQRIVADIKDEFLQSNHIQGTDRSSVALGLLFDDELVCCMTFGRGYNKKDGEVELVRFCNKLDTTVVGGASKLLKYFVNEHNFSKIVTYADRRFANNSKFYETIGFTKTGQTVPNYFYFKAAMPQYMRLMHRYNFAKHLLPRKLEHFDSALTEYENMKQNGYLKVYDAGSYKYEMISTKNPATI